MALKTPSMRQLCHKQGESIHSIFVYNETENFREFYCETAKTTMQNDEVLMILTYFETAETVKYCLKEAGIDVEFCSRTDSLFVIDSVKQFFGSTVENTLLFIELLNRKAKRQGRKGLAVVVDIDAFFHLKGDGLERYGRFVAPKSNPDKFACVVCTYHRGNFEKLPKEMQQIILKQHFLQAIL